jgi:hypothetical protein
MLLWGTFPRLSTVVVLLPRDMGGIPVRLHLLPRALVIGLVVPPFFATGGSPFLLWLGHHNVLLQPWSRTASAAVASSANA